MKRFQSWQAFAFGLVGISVVVGACGVDTPEGRGELAASLMSTGSMRESEEARALVDSLKTRFRSQVDIEPPRLDGQPLKTAPMLRERIATAIQRDGEMLHPEIPESALKGMVHPAQVVLPQRASHAFELTDQTTQLAAAVKLVDATDAEAEVADGIVVYRGGHASGADVLHRPTAEGTEDFFYFDKPPAESAIVYEVALGENVAGIRLVAGTLELLDAAGTPRLRMAAPYWMDAQGKQHEAQVDVSGCAYDTDPRGPWGRPVREPGASECRVRISWEADAAEYPAMVDPAWVTCGNLVQQRVWHVSATLPNGRVLLAGGDGAGTSLSNAELFDSSTKVWSPTGSMAIARRAPAKSVLPNGTVFVAGGLFTDHFMIYDCRASAEIYDPSAVTWSMVPTAMTAARCDAAATLINGKVLISGGPSTYWGISNTAEYFDPSSGTFTAAPSLPGYMAGHHAIYLPSVNKVLVVAGKIRWSSSWGPYLFDPVANGGQGAWTSTPPIPLSDGDGTGASLLPSGKVLMTGRRSSVSAGVYYYSNAAVIFDPATITWSIAAPMHAIRAAHFQETLLDGRVLVAGGTQALNNSAELYDEVANTWGPPTLMNFGQCCGSSNLLQDGSVLLAVGNESQMYVLGTRANGASCQFGAQCLSGFCADGVCCNSTCMGVCQSCLGAKTGGADGTCANIPVNTDPDNECAADCNGASECERGNGSACTLPAQCDNGFCVNGICCQVSACTALDQCHNAGTCQAGTGTCSNPNKPNGTACDDGSTCTKLDFCQSGACVGATKGTCSP